MAEDEQAGYLYNTSINILSVMFSILSAVFGIPSAMFGILVGGVHHYHW